MSVAFYMDVHIPAPITDGLRRHGIDVLTAQEDLATRLPDPRLLDRATTLNRILVTQDRDFLSITAARQAEGVEFPGIAYGPQLSNSIGRTIEDLSLMAIAGRPAEFANRVTFLPLG